jgi:hypothetical protein
MKRVLPSLAGIVTGSALLALSGLLLTTHLAAMHDVRQVALPLAAELPSLRTHLQLLKQQADLAELHAAAQTDSPEEKLRVYVLPANTDMARPLAFFDVLHDYLAQQKLLQSMEPIAVSDPVPVDGEPTLTARTLTLQLTLKPEGVQTLFALLRLTGTITVGDTIGAEDLQKLFALTEAENYAGIVPVEKFLSADLLSYVKEPKPFEQELTQSFPSEEFLRSFHSLLETSGLKDAAALLQGGMGKTLIAQKLWPMQFLQLLAVSTAEQPDGWLRVQAEVRVYAREKAPGS